MGECNLLNAKLNKHFAAFGAAAAALTGVGVAQQSDAAIVYSGVVNLAIPATIDGLYLNVVTATPGPTGAATAGWDINPYAAAASPNFFSPASAAASRGYVAATTTGAALNLAEGAAIGPLSTFNTGIAAGTNFVNGVNGLVGFRLLNEGGTTTHFGWARLSVPTGSTTGIAGNLVDYAWESTAGASIPAGIVPEPASLGLLALGALGLVARRR